MSDVTIILPAVSGDQVSNDLVDLTAALMNAGHETSGGFLGGAS